MELKFSIETESFRKKLRKEKSNLLVRAERVAELIAEEIINHARSKTGEKKPDGRSKHPGEWADITSNLANSIKSRIERDGLQVKAIVEATMEYAAALDAREGYDVLGGADQLARQAIKKYQHLIFK